MDGFDFAGLGVGARENRAMHNRTEMWSSRNRADRRGGGSREGRELG